VGLASRDMGAGRGGCIPWWHMPAAACVLQQHCSTPSARHADQVQRHAEVHLILCRCTTANHHGLDKLQPEQTVRSQWPWGACACSPDSGHPSCCCHRWQPCSSSSSSSRGDSAAAWHPLHLQRLSVVKPRSSDLSVTLTWQGEANAGQPPGSYHSYSQLGAATSASCRTGGVCFVATP